MPRIDVRRFFWTLFVVVRTIKWRSADVVDTYAYYNSSLVTNHIITISRFSGITIMMYFHDVLYPINIHSYIHIFLIFRSCSINLLYWCHVFIFVEPRHDQTLRFLYVSIPSNFAKAWLLVKMIDRCFRLAVLNFKLHLIVGSAIKYS